MLHGQRTAFWPHFQLSPLVNVWKWQRTPRRGGLRLVAGGFPDNWPLRRPDIYETGELSQQRSSQSFRYSALDLTTASMTRCWPTRTAAPRRLRRTKGPASYQPGAPPQDCMIKHPLRAEGPASSSLPKTTIPHSTPPSLHHSLTPSLHHSITPPLHLSTSPPLHLSITPSLHHSTSPPLHLSTSPPLHLSTSPPLHHSTSPPLHHSTTPPLHHSTTPPLHLSTSPPLHLSTPPPLHHSITPSLHHSITPSLHHSTPPPLHLSTSPPLHLSTSPPLHHSTTPPLHHHPPNKKQSPVKAIFTGLCN